MTTTSISSIPLSEYRARRESLLEALNGSVGLIYAGDHAHSSVQARFRADATFTYLTGLENESGGVILFDPTSEDPRKRISLFLRPLDTEADRWDGERDEIGSPLRAKTGFDSVMRTNMLPRMLGLAARRAKKLACLHPFTGYTSDVSRDLATFRKVAERIPGCGIEDRTQLPAQMRAIKSTSEVALMRRAAEATAAGYFDALKIIRPGVSEAEIQRILEAGYARAGGRWSAYMPIVGSGRNGTILHYKDNNGVCNDGELLVIDSGCDFAGYACDITRTFPVSGRFTDEQRRVYQVVLDAQKAAIDAIKPGVFLWQVDQAARDVIARAGLGDYFIHSIGHQLGLEVHDITPDGPLTPGMVITIEPGVYLPEKNLGIRIEDDILITPSGSENLTPHVPKEIDEIEKAMRA